MSAGKRRHKVAVQKQGAGERGRFGSTQTAWADHVRAWGEFIYLGGDVSSDAGRDAGRSQLKVRLRSTARSREIKPKDRLIHISQDDTYEIISVDAVTQRADVFLVVEGPISPEVSDE